METEYELFAVVIHKGTCYSGHYYGYIRDVDHIGSWTRPPPPPSPTVRNLRFRDKNKFCLSILKLNISISSSMKHETFIE